MKKKNKALFLDRDGVLNEVVFREKKISSPRSLEEIKITKSGSKGKISDQIVENTLIQEKDLNSMSKEEVVGIARQFKVRIPFKKLENVAKPRLIEKILYQRENRSLDEEEDCLTINIDEAIEIFSQPYTKKKSN